LPCTAIDGVQFRFAFQQQQKIGQRGGAGLGVKPRMDRFGKGQVIRRLDGETAALLVQRHIRFGAHDLHKIGMQLEIAGDMFARFWIMSGVHHQPVKRAPAEWIDPFMGAFRAVLQQNVIAVLLDKGGDQVIHKTSIDERNVGRHLHDDVGVQLLGGAGIAGQHIVFGTAHHGDALGIAPFHDRLIGRVRAGSHRDLLQQVAGPQSMHDVPQQRLARDGFEHLAGQTRRAHPRLNDGDDSDVLAFAGGIEIRAH